MWWAAKDSKDQLRGTSAQWATLGVLAKLSNEAVKCCKRDAMQQTDHNM
jgi:hypothetical protein